jgi:hypothetical protein
MADAVADDIRIDAKAISIVTGLSLAYILLSYLMVGYKSDQLVLAGIFNVFFTRRLLPVSLFWVSQYL